LKHPYFAIGPQTLPKDLKLPRQERRAVDGAAQSRNVRKTLEEQGERGTARKLDLFAEAI
jgi:hypothetical protein